MMKELDITKNYRVSDDRKTVYVDVEIDFYREIYSEWDFSPPANRDLDDDLFEYLEACAQEIPKKYSIAIVFHIPEDIYDEQKQRISVEGYRNYFSYQLRRLNLQVQKLRNKALLCMFFGILFLVFSNFIAKFFVNGFLGHFLAEGFMIGGWVLFWEVFSTLFFTFSEIRADHKSLKRLRKSKIIYQFKK